MRSPKASSKTSSSIDINQLTEEVSEISLNTSEDAAWEVYAMQSKGNAGTWSQQSSSPKGRNHPDVPQSFNQSLAGDSESADDEYYDSDADYALTDESDSDSSVKSHETRKKNGLLKSLFECMDGLTVDEINDSERRWHCPACKRGPGEIDWYRGLQPLIAHAKTKRATRLKLHRELAQLLEEELNRRGILVRHVLHQRI